MACAARFGSFGGFGLAGDLDFRDGFLSGLGILSIIARQPLHKVSMCKGAHYPAMGQFDVGGFRSPAREKTPVMTLPICHCNDGWVCDVHPDMAWPHDECPGRGMPCTNTRCPNGRQNIKRLKSGIGMSAELDEQEVADVSSELAALIAAIGEDHTMQSGFVGIAGLPGNLPVCLCGATAGIADVGRRRGPDDGRGIQCIG